MSKRESRGLLYSGLISDVFQIILSFLHIILIYNVPGVLFIHTRISKNQNTAADLFSFSVSFQALLLPHEKKSITRVWIFHQKYINTYEVLTEF